MPDRARPDAWGRSETHICAIDPTMGGSPVGGIGCVPMVCVGRLELTCPGEPLPPSRVDPGRCPRSLGAPGASDPRPGWAVLPTRPKCLHAMAPRPERAPSQMDETTPQGPRRATPLGEGCLRAVARRGHPAHMGA